MSKVVVVTTRGVGFRTGFNSFKQNGTEIQSFHCKHLIKSIYFEELTSRFLKSIHQFAKSSIKYPRKWSSNLLSQSKFTDFPKLSNVSLISPQQIGRFSSKASSSIQLLCNDEVDVMELGVNVFIFSLILSFWWTFNIGVNQSWIHKRRHHLIKRRTWNWQNYICSRIHSRIHSWLSIQRDFSHICHPSNVFGL